MARRRKSGVRGTAGIHGPLDSAGTRDNELRTPAHRSRFIKGGGKRRMGARAARARHRGALRAGFAHR